MNYRVQSLSTDLAGNAVIVHDLGLEIYDLTRNEFRHFGEEVGLKDKKGNLNSICKNQQGDILIGTENGIIQ